MCEAALPRLLPRHLVPHLPAPLSDEEAVAPQLYRLLRLDDIRDEQNESSYRLLEQFREEWEATGALMTVIEWRDGTQGILCIPPSVCPTAPRLLRAYRLARSKRELFEADGGRA